MSRRLAFSVALAAAALAGAASAEPWSRQYVAEWFEPAAFYGGPDGGTPESPGTDCPQGAIKANDYRKLLKTSYRTQAEVDQILDPNFNRQEMYRQFAIRGPNKENVLINPTSIPDPGMQEVTGAIAYGFDLDDNPKTGFTSPTGQKGIDNAFYKTAGCTMRIRNGGDGSKGNGPKYSNDGMRDGVYTLVIVVSGNQSPENDSDARFGFYLAKDPVVKDANGGVARNYTFRIDPDPKFQSVVPVSIRDGVIESTSRATINMRDWTTPGFFPQQLTLYETKFRFQMKPDGGLTGLLGGYRDWLIEYAGYSGNGTGTAGVIHENIERMSMPAYFYALRRNADGRPHPVTGKNTAISIAYRIDAVPAMAATPTADGPARVAQLYR